MIGWKEWWDYNTSIKSRWINRIVKLKYYHDCKQHNAYVVVMNVWVIYDYDTSNFPPRFY